MTEQDRQKRLLRDRGICVVIPTFNNEGTIRSVVMDCLNECDDVIVVNDGSTDNTGGILNDIKGITIVEYAGNRGKGYALKKGFAKALDMGFAYAITLDADGQHYPCDITKFLETNRKEPGTLIVGSRDMEGKERSKGSKFANAFSNFWFFIQTGRKLQDTQTGYRLYPIRKLHGLSMLTSRYEAELELLVFSSWHGIKLLPISIDVFYPPREERVSHFRPVKDFVRISILNTILCLLAVVYGLPLRILRFLSKYVRTYFSLAFFVFFSLFVITPLTWIYVKTGKMTEDKKYHIHELIQWIARFLMIKCGIPGTKFSYSDGGVSFDNPRIVISNHQSHLDLMCMLIFTPKLVFLTNDWVWNNPFYGFLIRHAEYYPVADGIDNLLPKLESLRNRGYSIAIFPEGTRSKDCSIGRFHQGAFYVAERLNMEILPMYLYGPGKVLPKKTYTLRKSPIHIEVGNPISQKELSRIGDTKSQASYMRKQYVDRYESLCNMIEKNV